MTGYHTPVLLSECIDGLKINPNGIYVDLTFGSGGHSREILKNLQKGRLVAFDQDESAKENIVNEDRFVFVQGNFRFFKNYLWYLGIKKVDGILADLGVSSHHFDSSERGFSYRTDGPLDMRMNISSKQTAATLINTASYEELSNIFYAYGEVENSRRVASLIVKAREIKPIETTFELCRALLPVTPRNNDYKFLSKVFQALRIVVNSEMEALREMLNQTEEMIMPGGRLVILTYHSLEDRDLKNFIKTGNFSGVAEKDVFGRVPKVPFRAINRKVIIPDENEIANNSRARSAKLRIAERND
jgi:16S rRNA (cytosine1402-N4)-methyltransferase